MIHTNFNHLILIHLEYIYICSSKFLLFKLLRSKNIFVRSSIYNPRSFIHCLCGQSQCLEYSLASQAYLTLSLPLFFPLFFFAAAKCLRTMSIFMLTLRNIYENGREQPTTHLFLRHILLENVLQSKACLQRFAKFKRNKKWGQVVKRLYYV